MAEPSHVPVMVERVVALVAPALTSPGSILVDATLGLGGHSAAILAACPHASVVGLDRDEAAILVAARRLERFASRTTLVHAVYDDIASVLDSGGYPTVQGVLFDLGVSSMQLDNVDRGFSYAHDAPLDMRMDRTSARTAAHILNTYPVAELARVLARYGEERFAMRIAQRIVAARRSAPFESSARLVEVIRDAIPAAARRQGGHPAKRAFQALRIEVNDELGILQRAIPAAVELLAVGGRIVVMSYQSLEDRLVKRALGQHATSRIPPDLPVLAAGHEPELRLLTRGAERATENEIAVNPRAASVRLRAAERVRKAA